MRLIYIALAAGAVLCSAATAQASEVRNHVFGKAAVKLNTAAENKAVVGKGYYADVYGYYGNMYASQALNYGNYAYSYGDSAYYSYASQYADGAAYLYNQAAFYQANGY